MSAEFNANHLNYMPHPALTTFAHLAPIPGQTVFEIETKQPLGTVLYNEGNLCHYARADTGKHSLFIWAFRSGLNRLRSWK